MIGVNKLFKKVCAIFLSFVIAFGFTLSSSLESYAYSRQDVYKRQVLHSSAIAVDGNAYLFSAHSGTGKSTHTSLWLDHFKDRALKMCIRDRYKRNQWGTLCLWNTLEWKE